MNKQKVILILTIVTIIGWAVSLALIFPEHVSFMMGLAIVFPIIPASVLIWVQSGAVPKGVLNTINDLAQQIEQNIEKDAVEIDEEGIPHEILPFVKKINQLLRYQNDRYQQERDFTANASHELRTPLAGIRLQTELAMMSYDPEKRDQALRNVIKSIDNGTRLVDQLLAISRITAEDVDLAMESVDLTLLGQKIIRVKHQMAEEKEINLNLDIQEGMSHLFVEASEESLNILISNLLRNSIIYTQKGGEVMLRLENNPKTQTASIIVSDNGPGIPKQLREKVLQRFEKGASKSKTGTGLGLSIVKRISDLHNGRFLLDTAESGRGLRASVEIPVQQF